MRNVNTLVTVAGHATYLDSVGRVPADPANERCWELQRFQKGEVPIYLTHMRRGAELVAANPASVGLMSGGRTRPAGGHWSEAESYLETAASYGFWQGDDEATIEDIRSRFDVERYARDSLENMWYSVLFYRQKLGHMPLHLLMVGWEVKQPRFVQHAQTLGIPDEIFSYIGVPLDVYGNTARPQDMEGFALAEKNTQEQWQNDPLGNSGPLLEKRTGRNPFNVTQPYAWSEYVDVAHEAGWRPGREVLAAAALEGVAA